MRKHSPATPDESADFDFTSSPLYVSDPTAAAKLALDHALTYSAGQMGLSGQAEVLDRLRGADSEVHSHFRSALAEQVAEYLGNFDHEIKVVYTYDFDETPEDACFSESLMASPLHLLVWAQRKTEALGALVDSLDRALSRHLARISSVQHVKHLLDVQIVDDDDVMKRSGYGAMLSSLHQRPLQVWKRP